MLPAARKTVVVTINEEHTDLGLVAVRKGSAKFGHSLCCILSTQDVLFY